MRMGQMPAARREVKAMAFNRTGSIVFVPAVNMTKGKAALSLEAIDPELKAEIEEMYTTGKTNPGGRFRLTFATKADKLQYLTQATAYAALRPEGAIWVRRSPTAAKVYAEAGLSEDTTMDMRVKDLPEDKGTEAINEAVDAVKAAAVVTPEATPATRRGRK